MDIIDVCAITAGSIVPLLLLLHLRPYLIRFLKYVSVLTLKHLTYPYLVHRHELFGPWSRAGIAIQMNLVLIILFCIIFKVSIFPISLRLSTSTEVGLRAGNLALITLIPLLTGAHHAFLADILGCSLQTMRLVHRSAGLAMSSLCLLHILAAVASKVPLPLDDPQNLFAVIVSVY